METSTSSTTKPPPFPRVLRIEPASQCNLSCSHCPTGTVDMDRGIMSNETFENILRNIEENKSYVKVVVLYHGGEPLLNKNFFKYVSAIKKINSEIFIKTVSNGMALTESTAKKILNSELDAIEFSLDGLSAEESQHIRVKSKTSKVIKNVKHLIAEKIKDKLEKPTISIATTQFVRKSDNEKVPSEAPIPDWLFSEFGDYVSYKTGFAMRWPHMGDSAGFELLETLGDDINECDHVISTMTVRADGDVVPCCYDLTSKLTMGNVNTNSLLNIWNGKKYEILRAAISNKKFYSICSTCAVVTPPVYLIPTWTHEIKFSKKGQLLSASQSN
jgi:radical SAM protein with 4Fe4S-binding SPASM domain